MSGEKTKSFSKVEEKFFLKVGENFYPEREKKNIARNRSEPRMRSKPGRTQDRFNPAT